MLPSSEPAAMAVCFNPAPAAMFRLPVRNRNDFGSRPDAVR
ncbi:hypothetical protein OKW76_07770 [Sphingomonas sp. S1-29]|nr:hypothetical protein [Sphingomonas sp. S1-29]UZK70906.1 hypothetical protein OKW76_07770 [Sphingomonas sp. S1-29]